MGTKIKLTNVRLAYCSVFEARAYEDTGTPKYDVTPMIEKGSALDKQIRESIETVGSEAFGKTWAKQKDDLLADKRACSYRDGDKTDYETHDGFMLLACKNKMRPTVVDRTRSPVTADDGVIYPGCYANVHVEMYAVTKGTKGIFASFTGVQFVKDGDAFGGSTPSKTTDFDDLGDGADAEDIA